MLSSKDINANNIFTHPDYIDISVLMDYKILHGFDQFHEKVLYSVSSHNKIYKKYLLIALIIFTFSTAMLTIVIWVIYVQNQKKLVKFLLILDVKMPIVYNFNTFDVNTKNRHHSILFI